MKRRFLALAIIYGVQLVGLGVVWIIVGKIGFDQKIIMGFAIEAVFILAYGSTGGRTGRNVDGYAPSNDPEDRIDEEFNKALASMPKKKPEESENKSPSK